MFNSRSAALAAGLLSLTFVTTTAEAQSSLGFNSLQIGTAYTGGDTLTEAGALSATLDFAITEYHGLQGEAGVVRYGSTTIAYLGGHLYMVPVAGQKYGVFALFEDVDNRSVSSAQLGIEGLFSIGEDLTLEARGGLGRVDPSSLDYIFVEFGLDYALSDDLSVSAHLTAADYDEASFSAQSADLVLAARYAVPGSGAVVSAGLRHSTLSGTNFGPADTSAFIGLSWQFGGDSGAKRSLRDRTFRPARPLDSLWRRGLVF